MAADRITDPEIQPEEALLHLTSGTQMPADEDVELTARMHVLGEEDVANPNLHFGDREPPSPLGGEDGDIVSGATVHLAGAPAAFLAEDGRLLPLPPAEGDADLDQGEATDMDVLAPFRRFAFDQDRAAVDEPDTVAGPDGDVLVGRRAPLPEEPGDADDFAAAPAAAGQGREDLPLFDGRVDTPVVEEPPRSIEDELTLEVPEDAVSGAVVTRLGGSGTYYIVSGNDDGAFAVDASTGVLTVADASRIDFETGPTRFLVIQSDDGVTVHTFTITVDVMDVNEAPVLSDADFTISEAAASGAAVGTLTATDQDAGAVLSYSITGGNADGAFTIDAATGAVTVADPSVLDHETAGTRTLTVEVS
ncbi:MAG: cadherin repeat domain-containing protein [Rhodospirillaceae bacterium]|nr:cadherin repeat domain-containing protein [Rhodospirillaceae bacterium]